MLMNEDMLLSQIQAMSHNASDVFESYPVLYLPADYDMEVDPVVLQSGQHRVAALLQLFSRHRTYTGYTKDLFTRKTVPVRGACAIHNC